jgi:hypothetical protein|tara:strand:+ start:7869 stop:8081 length:213 start_codon:yes stop_codon:yes gene_type:complete
MKYTEDNIGDIIEYSDERGSYYEERVVLVYCQICGARYIGPIREAGGFLGGHEVFHTWEFKIQMNEELEA